MRIGRRPDDRYSGVILDLFGRLISEEDRTQLMSALQFDRGAASIVLQLENLTDINEQGLGLLISLSRGMGTSCAKLILVRPQGKVLATLRAHGSESKLSIFENESEALKFGLDQSSRPGT